MREFKNRPLSQPRRIFTTNAMLLCAGLGVASVANGNPAHARVIDLSKSSCAQFSTLAPVDKEQIVLWLAGFYAGAAQRPSLDTALLGNARKAIDELCFKTPAAPLIGAETRPLLLGPAAP